MAISSIIPFCSLISIFSCDSKLSIQIKIAKICDSYNLILLVLTKPREIIAIILAIVSLLSSFSLKIFGVSFPSKKEGKSFSNQFIKSFLLIIVFDFLATIFLHISICSLNIFIFSLLK